MVSSHQCQVANHTGNRINHQGEEESGIFQIVDKQRHLMLSVLKNGTRTSLRVLSAHPIKSSTFGWRHFASRPHRQKARRSQLATSKRVARQLKEEETKHAGETVDSGEQVLSEKGMKYGFFLTLGVFPLIAFSVVVSTTPHLREQFDHLLASVTGGKTRTGALSNEENSQ
eukprot:scaffold42761_cov160-Amphora_coffeaeformis.AAC.6